MLTTKIEHSEFVEAFFRKLQATTEWSDDRVSTLAVYFSDALADIGANNSYAIRFAAREAFIRLAKRKSSVLESARFLGVDINRNTPATVSAMITNSTGQRQILAKHTEFNLRSNVVLLAESMQIEAGESKEIDFVVGTKFRYAQTLTNVQDFLRIELGTKDFKLSSDIKIYTESKTRTRREFRNFKQSMFMAATGEDIFQDITTDEGDVAIQFGGELWGSLPDEGNTLYVEGVLSDGSNSNLDSLNLGIECIDHPQLAGRTTSTISGGADPKDLEYYRTFAPIVARSKNKLIRAEEWKAGVMLHPDVADCVIMGQRDIAPNDKEWMSVVRVCVLPISQSSWGGINPNPESPQWRQFRKWASQYSAMLDIQSWNPEKLPIDVLAEVALYEDAPGKKEVYKAILEKAITDVFARRPGLLGKKLAISDLMEALIYEEDEKGNKKRRDYVDYATILSPEKPVNPNSKLEYVSLRNLRLNIKYSER